MNNIEEQLLYIKQLEEENQRLKLSNKSLRKNIEGLMEGQKKLEKRLGGFRRRFGTANITFSGVSRKTGQETTWTINSYEEIMKEWWNNAGINLMPADAVAHNISVDGEPVSDRKFSELMSELTARYWDKFAKGFPAREHVEEER